MADLKSYLNLPGCRPIPIVQVSATRGEGLEELWTCVEGALADKESENAKNKNDGTSMWLHAVAPTR